jgi:hypothetical protein
MLDWPSILQCHCADHKEGDTPDAVLADALTLKMLKARADLIDLVPRSDFSVSAMPPRVRNWLHGKQLQRIHSYLSSYAFLCILQTFCPSEDNRLIMG